MDALRDLVAAKKTHGAQQCTYVSLGAISDTAKRFAATQGITLRVRIKLMWIYSLSLWERE